MRLPVVETFPVGSTTGHRGQPATEVVGFVFGFPESLRVTVWSYGASLVAVTGPDDRGVNLVRGPATLAEFEDGPRHSYPGATLGRFARCIREARFPLDGRTVRLCANAGRHHIHGGDIGFDRYVWTARPVTSPAAVGVRLQLDRPDGDQGYPGAVRAQTTYTVDRHGTLSVEHRATTTAPTVLALSTHAFWDLSGTGAAGAVDDHELQVRAERYLEVDDDLMPCGPARPVAGTPCDFRRPRRIGATALDHSLLLEAGPGPAAVLRHRVAGRALAVVTDQPGVQLYTGDLLAGAGRRAGLCLQTGALPDAPNRPDLPPARLDPGQVYRHRTEYRLEHGLGSAG